MAETYSFRFLSNPEAASYQRLWATVRAALPTLTELETATVVSLVIDSCHECHDDSAECQCWNDE